MISQEDPSHSPSIFGLALTFSQLGKLDQAWYYLQALTNTPTQTSKSVPSLRLDLVGAQESSTVPKTNPKEVLKHAEILKVFFMVKQGEIKAAHKSIKTLLKQQKPSLWHILLR